MFWKISCFKDTLNIIINRSAINLAAFFTNFVVTSPVPNSRVPFLSLSFASWIIYKPTRKIMDFSPSIFSWIVDLQSGQVWLKRQGSNSCDWVDREGKTWKPQAPWVPEPNFRTTSKAFMTKTQGFNIVVFDATIISDTKCFGLQKMRTPSLHELDSCSLSTKKESDCHEGDHFSGNWINWSLPNFLLLKFFIQLNYRYDSVPYTKTYLCGFLLR